MTNIGTVLPWFPSHAAGESILAVFVYRELKRLVERGNEAVVITVRRPGMPEFEVMDGIQVYRFPSCAVRQLRYELPNFPRLNRLIADISKRHKLDIIQFVNSDFLTSIPAIYIGKRTGLPVVVVVNGLPGISWFTGNWLIDKMGWIYTNLIGRRIIKSSDGVRLLQSPIFDELAGMGVQRNRMKVIHRGIDTGVFHPSYDKMEVRAELGLKEEDFVVLWVGRLVKPVEMKGTRHLIEAVKELVPLYGNLKLVLVGDGNGRAKNEEWVRSIKDRVIFTGFRSDTYRLMSAADVLVLPSLGEGCPNVVLEASACGTPVIASRVGAVPDLIEDGRTGIIVSPSSSEEIKQALIQLIEDPSLIKGMGERARERMEKEFTWDAICEKLEGFYLEVINNYQRRDSNKGRET